MPKYQALQDFHIFLSVGFWTLNRIFRVRWTVLVTLIAFPLVFFSAIILNKRPIIINAKKGGAL
jgi:hypothetical protein